MIDDHGHALIINLHDSSRKSKTTREREKERQREVVSRVINRSRINSTIIKRRSLESPVQRKAEDERRGEKLREKGGGFCVLKRQLGSEP